MGPIGFASSAVGTSVPLLKNAASKVVVMLPKVLVASVLNQLYSSVTGGLGIQKLQEKERDHFYRPLFS